MLAETLNAIGLAVTGAIREAAQATGTGFAYLLATAKIESGLDPKIKSSNSSATGLFQFIEQTWLMTMKQAGAELGYGRYAAAIQKSSSGRYTVSDPAMRAEILNLRKDPTANAAMAGALTRLNADRLRGKIGRDPTEGELYIAHFLGAGGAAKLINAAATTPNAKAAQLFPRAAAANRSIFYDQQGGARSVTGVYGLLVTKLAHAMPEVPTQVAQAASPVAGLGAVGGARAAPAAGASSMLSPTLMANVSPVIPMPPLAASIAPLMAHPPHGASVAAPPLAPAAASPEASALPPTVSALAATDDGNAQIFHDLFRTGGHAGVSQTVSQLWGAPTGGGAQTSGGQPISALTPAAPVPPANGADQGHGFDLFRARSPQS